MTARPSVLRTDYGTALPLRTHTEGHNDQRHTAVVSGVLRLPSRPLSSCGSICSDLAPGTDGANEIEREIELATLGTEESLRTGARRSERGGRGGRMAGA